MKAEKELLAIASRTPTKAKRNEFSATKITPFQDIEWEKTGQNERLHDHRRHDITSARFMSIPQQYGLVSGN